MAVVLDHRFLMEPYNPYRSQSDIRHFGQQQASQPYNRPIDDLPSENHLPSFSEILSNHVRTETDCVSLLPPPISADSELPVTSGQPVIFDSRPSLSFPEQLSMLSMPDGFDDYHRGHNPPYHTQHHSRHSASWATSPHNGDMTSTFGNHQRHSYQGQNTSYPRPNTNLPPIRDLDPRNERASMRENAFMSPNGQYAQEYGYSQPGGNVQTNTSYSSRAALYYDSNPRYNQPYAPMNRPYAQPASDFSRFAQSSLDAYRPPAGFTNSYSGSQYITPSEHGNEAHVYGAPTESADTRNRRRRGNLPKSVTDVLRGWFHAHLDHPYPTEEDKQLFMTQTGLTMNQISNWFINARRRHLPALRHARNHGNGTISTDRGSGPPS